MVAVVVGAVTTGHKGKAVVRATVGGAVDGGTESGVGVEGGFLEDFTAADDVSGGLTVHCDGESAADVEVFKRGESEGGVTVEEVAAVAHITHNTVAGVNGGTINRGRIVDVKAGRLSRRLSGRGDVRVRGNRDAGGEVGSNFLASLANVEFFGSGESG